jgi:hypothetical protein
VILCSLRSSEDAVRRWTATLFLLWFFAPANAVADGPRAPRPAGARVFDAERRLDINDLTLFVSNNGLIGQDPISGGGGLLFPRGASSSVLYASGLWIGARVNGELRVTTTPFLSEYAPGAMVDGAADDPDRPAYRVWKVARWTGAQEDSAHVERSGAELAADPTLDPLVHHGYGEYMANAAPYGAPVHTIWVPIPGGGAYLESIPDVLGDVMLWSIYNDADPARHTETAGSTAPLGVEVRQTVFGYRGLGPEGQMCFIQWRVVNRSSATLDSLRLAFWLDPDLGGSFDDLAACDTSKSLGYVYNGLDQDEVYGSRPPAIGVDLLDEAFDDDRGRVLGMDAFPAYRKAIDPDNALASWKLMHGVTPYDPPLGEPPFAWTGDPVTGTPPLDDIPVDHRLLLARGKGSLAPGDSVDLTAAIIVGRRENRLQSIVQVRCLDDWAQAIRDAGFPPVLPIPAVAICPGTPPPPPPPDVLAISTFFPNPGSGVGFVRVTLRTGDRATLQVLDLHGRVRVRRELVGYGPGTHTIAIADRLTPGFYVLRLSEAGLEASAKGVVLK